MLVTTGRKISLEYTLWDDSGDMLDTNVGGEPLTYVHGQQQILPKLEEALEGLQVGASKKVALRAEDAYGDVDEGAIIEVPLDRVPEEARTVGTRLRGESPDGRVVTPIVVELREGTALLDFNHPLAGLALRFEVKVLGVESASGSSIEIGD
jgi:FKBP-type peptidyl-prolyl cis-trans isomerase SlyD